MESPEARLSLLDERRRSLDHNSKRMSLYSKPFKLLDMSIELKEYF